MSKPTGIAKARNMLQIIGWFDAGARLSSADIARRLQVSQRTAARYIADMETIGVPLISEGGCTPVYRRFRRNETERQQGDADLHRFMRGHVRALRAARNRERTSQEVA